MLAVGVVFIGQRLRGINDLPGKFRRPVSAQRHFLEDSVAQTRARNHEAVHLECPREVHVNQQCGHHCFGFLISDVIPADEFLDGQGQELFDERTERFVINACHRPFLSFRTELRGRETGITGHGHDG